MTRLGVPADVDAIRRSITNALNLAGDRNRKVGDSRFGVYAFFDYDGEPIYVGQTKEKLRVRIRRHLTNHRTDAVAMNVLDPFEVADIEMWPLWDLSDSSPQIATEKLNATEYTVFQNVLAKSSFGAVLNEKDIGPTQMVELPPSIRVRIIPEGLFETRKHPDVRIARRSNTIAGLAKVISERDVSPGLRRTLVTQAQRLQALASARFEDFADDPIEVDEGK
jgi:hypothetical protein